MATAAGHNRRDFLAVAGMGAVTAAAASPADAIASARRVARADLMLAPNLVHLNTASLGPAPRQVLDATIRAWRALESSPVAMGYSGAAPSDARKVVNQADAVRAKGAALLGCDGEEILVTRGTTDGMNTLAQSLRLARGDRILTTDLEHHGGSLCWDYLARRDGVIVDRVTLALDDHEPQSIVDRFKRALTPATRVISISHVVSATGLRMPVADLAALARSRDMLCLVDGAQAAGHVPVDVKALGCHAYATSGHKWVMGPKGTGLLYVSRDADRRIEPIQWGDRRHYGAEAAGVGPMALAVGLGSAIDLIQAWGLPAIERHNLDLRDQLWRVLRTIDGVDLVGPPPGPHATAIIACRLPDRWDSAAVRQIMQDRHGIIVKQAEKRWLNGLRFSPHLFNSAADVDAAMRALAMVLRG